MEDTENTDYEGRKQVKELGKAIGISFPDDAADAISNAIGTLVSYTLIAKMKDKSGMVYGLAEEAHNLRMDAMRAIHAFLWVNIMDVKMVQPEEGLPIHEFSPRPTT